jgi:hypothetical protein
MNTLIRVRGWIMESSIINPQTSIEEPDKIHKLRIQPENHFDFKVLEERVRDLKLKSEITSSQGISQHKDELIEGCEMIFKSFFKPKLCEDLESIKTDDELLGRFVQAVGHIRLFKDRNAMLTVHILEPAYLEDFDPLV